MRATMMTAVLAMLLFAGCKKEEAEKPNEYQVIVVVTVDYGTGKVVQFIYHNKLVWQSSPNISSMSYQESKDLDAVDINYVCTDGSKSHISFVGGKLNRE